MKEIAPSTAWMRAEEVAQHLGISLRMVRDQIYPNVDTLKVGRVKLIGRASFQKYIAYKTKHGRAYMAGCAR